MPKDKPTPHFMFLEQSGATLAIVKLAGTAKGYFDEKNNALAGSLATALKEGGIIEGGPLDAMIVQNNLLGTLNAETGAFPVTDHINTWPKVSFSDDDL